MPPLKVGLMLPATGTFAALGDAIEKGFKLHVQEQGGKLGGREIQYFKVDDESDPSKATDNVNKLIKRDQVDVLVGTVHSGVALAMARAAKRKQHAADRPQRRRRRHHRPAVRAQHLPQLASATGSRPTRMGLVAGQKGVKRAMTITWNYAAGTEVGQGLHRGPGKERRQGDQGPQPALPERRVPGPADRDRGAEARRRLRLLRRRRGGQVRQGLRRGGTEEVDPAVRTRASSPTARSRRRAPSAQGLLTTLHYADNLDTPRNNAFRKGYALAYKANADVYAVQGYDAAQILGAGLAAVKGDFAQARRADRRRCARRAIDSPRGKFTISAAGNPVQDIYLREVKGTNNEFRSIAAKALADPARGCKL